MKGSQVVRKLQDQMATQGASGNDSKHRYATGPIWPCLTSRRLIVILSVKIIILFALAVNSIVVMDEFVQLGWAKYFGNGMFETIWPVKAVGYAVFYKLAHLTGWDATSTILIGRLMTAILGVGIVAMVYACARGLTWSRFEALVVVVVLLSYSNFIERIFRTRAEPLSVFFAVASLLVLVRGELVARRVVLAGVLSGLSFITTQKAIYFNVALGAALVIDALMKRDLALAMKRGSLLVCGWFLPVLFYVVAFGGSTPLPVVQNLFFGPSALISDVPQLYSGMERYLIDTFAKNVLLYTVCVVGMVSALARAFRLESPQRIALVFSILICILVYSHNQPWPYLFVMSLPFLSLWVVPAIRAASQRPGSLNILAILLVSAVALSFVRNIYYLSQFGNAHQFEVIRNAEHLTGPSDQYFDGVGILPNRSEPSSLWLDLPLVRLSLEESEQSELYAVFSGAPPKTVIWSYRMDAVAPVIQPLLSKSYVKVAPNILFGGTHLKKDTDVVFRPPVPGSYDTYSELGVPLKGRVLLDGKAAALPLSLDRQTYIITLVEGPEDALLVPEGDYSGIFDAQAPNISLFRRVYD